MSVSLGRPLGMVRSSSAVLRFFMGVGNGGLFMNTNSLQVDAVHHVVLRKPSMHRRSAASIEDEDLFTSR